MAELKAVVDTLNSASPLAVIAGLAYIVYMLARQRQENRSATQTITDNHLHDLPEISDALHRMEQQQAAMAAALLGQLSDIRESLAYIRARLNSK